MEKIKHGLCLFFALFVLMTTAVFAGFTPVNTVLAAENTENNFDDTAVTDDLSEYDLSQFVYDKNGSIQFVTLAEYCFSASALNMENYALYVYIYNPARLAISERQGANTVNMAIAYDEDGNPCDYANVPLKLCGIATGDHSKLLYKFRIIDEDGAILRNARTHESDPSFWDNWINWGLWNAMTGNIPQEESRTVAPIYTLKADDLNGTDEEISERLLINPHDVSALRDYYNEAITVDTSTADEEKVVVLFRFATSDYYSAAVDIIELGKGFLWSDKHTSGQAYRAWESVFLDFDIIQLSFQKDGAYTVIPAVSDPIDIVNDITPPVYIPDGLEWWQILLIVLGVIVGLFLLIMFFPAIIGFIGKLIVWIFKGLWWLISAPFRLIKTIIEKIKEKRG